MGEINLHVWGYCESGSNYCCSYAGTIEQFPSLNDLASGQNKEVLYCTSGETQRIVADALINKCAEMGICSYFGPVISGMGDVGPHGLYGINI